jgi:xanthine dehydrogenase accessory factor
VNVGSFVLLKNDEINPSGAEGWVDKHLREEARRMAETETSGIVKTNGQDVFVDIYAPSPRLIAIGAVHIALPLTLMAQIAGFSTVVIDPRKAFNTKSRFPNVGQQLLIWPDEGLRGVGLNSNDYVLLLTHDDKLDLPALEMALNSEVKYIGMLSSRQARDKRFELLKEKGFSQDQLERVHSPVGLDIGARSQEEIALSILAEMIAVRYGKTV